MSYIYLSTFVPDIVGIKYVDGVNKIWNTAWAREARGRFYHVTSERAVPLKDGLQRGVELLTKAHLEDGVNETQDVSRCVQDKNQLMTCTINIRRIIVHLVVEA